MLYRNTIFLAAMLTDTNDRHRVTSVAAEVVLSRSQGIVTGNAPTPLDLSLRSTCHSARPVIPSEARNPGSLCGQRYRGSRFARDNQWFWHPLKHSAVRECVDTIRLAKNRARECPTQIRKIRFLITNISRQNRDRVQGSGSELC